MRRGDKFRHRIKNRRVLALLDRIVDGSNEQEPVLEWFPGDNLFTPAERRRGLPIGNLTSQWFANWYLTDFDHAITSRGRIGGYVRYCDDFVLLDRSRQRLRELLSTLNETLTTVRLKLHTVRARKKARRREPGGSSSAFASHRVRDGFAILPCDVSSPGWASTG